MPLKTTEDDINKEYNDLQKLAVKNAKKRRSNMKQNYRRRKKQSDRQGSWANNYQYDDCSNTEFEILKRK